QSATKVIEGAPQIRGCDPDGETLVQSLRECLRERHRVQYDLSEERVLVGVIVVQGAFGEAGQRRDLLHRRARIPLAQEQCPRGICRGCPGPDDPRVIRARPLEVTLLPPSIPPLVRYYTHE